MVTIRTLIFILLGMFAPVNIQATVFGDANSQNGMEDQRQTRSDADMWPKEFKSVGRVICQNVVQGSAILFKQRGSDGEVSPRLLTAKHVIERFGIEHCLFAPEGDSWNRANMVSVLATGIEEGSSFIASKYSKDWIVIELFPWLGWQQNALNPHAININTVKPLHKGGYQAHMVSFDVLRNKMVVHLNCRFGSSDQSDLLSGYPGLYWDNCDSTQGGSGGALFMGTDNGYKLVGLRVGSLFDESIVGSDPEMGSRFDVNSSINVSKAVSIEIFEPVCTFAEMRCEPVGNTDTLVEN